MAIIAMWMFKKNLQITPKSNENSYSNIGDLQQHMWGAIYNWFNISTPLDKKQLPSVWPFHMLIIMAEQRTKSNNMNNLSKRLTKKSITNIQKSDNYDINGKKRSYGWQ